MKKIDKQLLERAKREGIWAKRGDYRYDGVRQPIHLYLDEHTTLISYLRQCDVYTFCQKHGIAILNDTVGGKCPWDEEIKKEKVYRQVVGVFPIESVDRFLHIDKLTGDHFDNVEEIMNKLGKKGRAAEIRILPEGLEQLCEELNDEEINIDTHWVTWFWFEVEAANGL